VGAEREGMGRRRISSCGDEEEREEGERGYAGVETGSEGRRGGESGGTDVGHRAVSVRSRSVKKKDPKRMGEIEKDRSDGTVSGLAEETMDVRKRHMDVLLDRKEGFDRR
jgi:hypothetical protein